MKVAVLASRRIAQGFLLGGIHEAFICETEEEAKNAFKHCMDQQDIGIVLISRIVSELIPGSIQEAKKSPCMIPVISIIPDVPKPREVCGE